jgi:tetratricopeptide (TPR) repeat protein
MRFALLIALLGGLAAAAPVRADARTDFDAATLAAKTGKREAALALVTKAIDSKEATGRDLANMHYFRAELYSQAGKLDESVADYTAAIENLPDFASAFHDRAIVYAQQKKYQQALDDLSRAQFLVPRNPLPYFNRGRVFEMMDKRNEAIVEYRKARALGPQLKEPQEALKRLGAR